MFEKAVIGGTFNTVHKGHMQMLRTGLLLSKSAVIGLTSDDFATRFRIDDVNPYSKRKKSLEDVLDEIGKPYSIVEIKDSYGIATIDPEIDCIIVSEETLLRAEEINTIRFKKGLKKLVIVVVPLSLADDGKPISGTRISLGEINNEGRLMN